MNLICLGLSHATTPVALREHFAIPENRLSEFLIPRNDMPEYAILSTCNRLELYAALPGLDESCLLILLESISGLTRDFFAGYLYRYLGQEAVRHLARVATGLDSLIVGESQILGQVIYAFEAARQCSVTGPTLNAAFRSAIHAGKRARKETEIERRSVSISSAAVRLAQDALGDLSSVRALVIGAGEMAGLAVEALHQRGVAQIMIANRTLKTAQKLAASCDGQAFSLKQLDEALANADLVIASSGAPYIVVTPAILQRVAVAQSAPRPSPLVFIDIAVPRNISPEVASLPDVLYYDIDALTTALDEGLARRERSIPLVKAIIAEEVAAYDEWERQQQVAPIIASLYVKAETIRQTEIERSLRRWPNAGEEERKRLEALTEAIINRLLHQAILHLKANAGEEQAARYAAMLQELFALDFSI